MNCTIRYADNQELNSLLPQLYEILYTEMHQYLPTGSYEEGYSSWKSCMSIDMQDRARKLVLLYDGDTLIGFFKYSIHDQAFTMEEIQFREAYRGQGLFQQLYRQIIKELPDTLLYVEANTYKQNYKTQAILEHLGLSIIGENKSGLSYCYRGEYKVFAEHFRE